MSVFWLLQGFLGPGLLLPPVASAGPGTAIRGPFWSTLSEQAPRAWEHSRPATDLMRPKGFPASKSPINGFAQKSGGTPAFDAKQNQNQGRCAQLYCNFWAFDQAGKTHQAHE